MAIDPALGMNDIGYARAGTADGILVAVACKGIEKRLYFLLGINHKLDVVPSGETQESVTMFIRDIAYFTNILNRYETR